MMKEMNPEKAVEELAKKLEGIDSLKPPEWARFVKTGVHNERPPSQKNWWFLRSASILRKLSLGKPIGVSRLRKQYGGRKNRGHKPEHKYPASGSVISEVLQQLEASGFVKTEKGKGRMITHKGRMFIKDTLKTTDK